MLGNPLRLGFIGGALDSAVGYTHLTASRLDGYFRVDAGCFSRCGEQNERTAKVYGVSPERCYSDWLTLLEQEKGQVDALVILTPTPSHAEIVTSAIEAGYPVICEKALATSADECIQIESAVKANRGYLAVTYNYSGYPMVRELRRMISEGHFGSLQQIQIEMPQEGFLRINASPQEWRRKDYAVPTVSLDLGVHVHHLVDFLSGGLKPISLVGEHASYGQVRGIVDNVYCIARYENDLRVQAWWGKTALGHRNGLRVRVYGEKASAEWYQMDPEILNWADNDGHLYRLDRGSSDAKLAQEPRYNRFKAGHPSGFIEALASLYTDFAEQLSGLKSGSFMPSPYVYGVEQALEGIRMMEAIDNSFSLREWVSVIECRSKKVPNIF
jgi:predicted dehydrogenase